MIQGTFTKQPNEVLDYDMDFSEYLPSTDTISTATATIYVNPDPLAATTLHLDTTYVFPTARIVKQWLSAGTDGMTYQVQIQITTSEGRVKEAEFRIKVKED